MTALSDVRNIEITRQAQIAQAAKCCRCKEIFQKNCKEQDHCPRVMFSK